jgi:hypothetical protein
MPPDPTQFKPLPPVRHIRIDNSCEIDSEEIPHDFKDFDYELKNAMRDIPTADLAREYPEIIFSIVKTKPGTKPAGHDFCVDRKGGKIWCVGDWRKKE